MEKTELNLNKFENWKYSSQVQIPFTKVWWGQPAFLFLVLGRWSAHLASGRQGHHYPELKSSLCYMSLCPNCPNNKIKQSEYYPMRKPSSNSNIIYKRFMKHDSKQKRRSSFQLYSLVKWLQNKEDWRNNIKYLSSATMVILCLSVFKHHL